MSVTETHHCSGCGQDKPLQQFQVNEENRDGTTWVRTRKWCHACCRALAETQAAAASQRVQARRSQRERDEERWRALGPLPPWCEARVLDYLVNGRNSKLIITGIPECRGRTQHETRAKHMLLLWLEFQKHERAIGEPLGGRGTRFIQAMAGLLQESETKFREKLRRMCKHENNLLNVFETASVIRMRRPKLRPV